MTLERATTPEGMRIYVDTMPAVTTAYVNMHIGVGSVHESTDLAGISHALEHCVYVSTDSFRNEQALNDFDDMHSIDANANTNAGHTAYYATGPFVDPIMRRMGEMLTRATFKPAYISQQMDVITQEAKMWQDNIDVLHETAAEYGLFNVPYGRMIIGNADKLHFDPDQLREYYKRHYVLSNMAIVAVGNVQIEQVMRGVENYFDPTDHTLAKTELPEPQRLDAMTTGMLHDGSESAQISISTALDAPFTQQYLHNKQMYSAAMSAISRRCYEKLCIESGLSYIGHAAFETENHQNAWRIHGYATVHPENVHRARGMLDDVLSTPGKKYSDHKLAGAIGSELGRILSISDSIEYRGRSYVHDLSNLVEPVAISSVVDDVRNLEPRDVRNAIDCIVEYLDGNVPMTHITGSKEAIKGTDRRIKNSELL